MQEPRQRVEHMILHVVGNDRLAARCLTLACRQSLETNAVSITQEFCSTYQHRQAVVAARSVTRSYPIATKTLRPQDGAEGGCNKSTD